VYELKPEPSLSANSGLLGADVTSGTFAGCRNTMTANTITHWRLQVTGSGVVVGSNTVFSSATVRAVSLSFAGGTYTGDLTSGVTASQPISADAPVSLVLANASRIVGPLTGSGSGQITGTYTLTGLAASYSLGA
jgi:hypothetical protein